MKKITFYLFVAILSFGLSVSSCSEGDDAPDYSYGYIFTDVINSYVDNNILVVYADLRDKAWILNDMVTAYSSNQSQENLNAVCAAWRAARIPWEQSESFLYGPADLNGLDPSLDSWPLDKDAIDQLIRSNNSIKNAINSDELRGFHTIEYLIFENGSSKTSALSAREVEYLVAVTEALRNDCVFLWASWNGPSGIPARDQAVITSAGFDVGKGYVNEFRNAGTVNADIYISQDDAIDEIIDGCMTIAEEVGTQKIATPRDFAKQGDVERGRLEVESWYSFNSIDDYSNNIISIQNSYMGGIEGKRGASLSDFVKSRNSALDTKVRNAINKAYTAIYNDATNSHSGMLYPFRDNLTGTKVDAAIAACVELSETLSEIKTLRNVEIEE